MHSQAHIESYAVDLAWDILLRFARPEPSPADPLEAGASAVEALTSAAAADAKESLAASPASHATECSSESKTPAAAPATATHATRHLLPGASLPREYFSHWLQVAYEEATHFLTWDKRLGELGSHYGALPVHDGLWESALSTKDDLLARLAVVHCVHEAHGLDCGPRLLNTLRTSPRGEAGSAFLTGHHLSSSIPHPIPPPRSPLIPCAPHPQAQRATANRQPCSTASSSKRSATSPRASAGLPTSAASAGGTPPRVSTRRSAASTAVRSAPRSPARSGLQRGWRRGGTSRLSPRPSPPPLRLGLFLLRLPLLLLRQPPRRPQQTLPRQRGAGKPPQCQHPRPPPEHAIPALTLQYTG